MAIEINHMRTAVGKWKKQDQRFQSMRAETGELNTINTENCKTRDMLR